MKHLITALSSCSILSLMLTAGTVQAATCEVGDIYYNDDTCSKTYQADKIPLGVVFNAQKHLVLGRYFYEIPSFNKMNMGLVKSSTICSMLSLGGKKWRQATTEEIGSWFRSYAAIERGLIIADGSEFILQAYGEDTAGHGIDESFAGDTWAKKNWGYPQPFHAIYNNYVEAVGAQKGYKKLGDLPVSETAESYMYGPVYNTMYAEVNGLLNYSPCYFGSDGKACFDEGYRLTTKYGGGLGGVRCIFEY